MPDYELFAFDQTASHYSAQFAGCGEIYFYHSKEGEQAGFFQIVPYFECGNVTHIEISAVSRAPDANYALMRVLHKALDTFDSSNY